MKFFDRMLTVFFDRQNPDSTSANPRFMKKTRDAVSSTQMVSSAMVSSSAVLACAFEASAKTATARLAVLNISRVVSFMMSPSRAEAPRSMRGGLRSSPARKLAFVPLSVEPWSRRASAAITAISTPALLRAGDMAKFAFFLGFRRKLGCIIDRSSSDVTRHSCLFVVC